MNMVDKGMIHVFSSVMILPYLFRMVQYLKYINGLFLKFLFNTFKLYLTAYTETFFRENSYTEN